MKPVGPSRRRTIRTLVWLAAALAVLWVWSGFFSLTLMTNVPPGSDFDVSLRYGAVQIERREIGSWVPGGIDLRLFHLRYLNQAIWYIEPVLDWTRGARSFSVRMPLWMPVVLLVIGSLHLNTKERRRPPHACDGCGYDRSDDPDAKCPECGRG